MNASELYEATRKWWIVADVRRQIGSKQAPTWAMAVFNGVVRAVYRIEVWTPAPEEAAKRWGFRGSQDSELEALYLHRDVSSYLRNPQTGRPSQFPLRYINC